MAAAKKINAAAKMPGSSRAGEVRVVAVKLESLAQAGSLMQELGVSRQGIEILAPKSVFAALCIKGISSWEANIIKQHMLSLGSDAAINRDALIKDIKTSSLVFGSISQLRKLCGKLKNQPFSLPETAAKISFSLDNLCRKEFVFTARRKQLTIKTPVICGIMNLTPDSFSGDGLFKSVRTSTCQSVRELALKKAEEMIRDGAKIIDLGGESTRPFSQPIKEDEEIRRVIPVLRAIRKEFKSVFLSVDTYKYGVADAAVDEGVDIINDITALRASPRIVSLLKKHKLGCILMHTKGMPRTMQANPGYVNVVEEIIGFFKERLSFLAQEGIDEKCLLIDPGIGFGKRREDNLKIINELYKFKIFGLPVFLGLSRKSFIGKVLNTGVGERGAGTLAASMVAVVHGVNVLRVHDVKDTQQALKIAAEIFNN